MLCANDIIERVNERLKKSENVDIKKPFPNEHACRVHDPDDLGSPWGRNTTTIDGKQVGRIYGDKNGHPVLQAYRYPKDTWASSSARTHCNSVNGRFEAAVSKEESKENYSELFSSLQSLSNVDYPISKGSGFGSDKWYKETLIHVLKHFAATVDMLRSAYFPVIPPRMTDVEYNTLYWKCYIDAKKYKSS